MSTAEMTTSIRSLLDLDSDLAEMLDRQVLAAARAAAVAVTVELEPGPVAIEEWLAQVAPGPGLLVLGGFVALNLRVGDRIASELLGAGDLIQPPAGEYDEMLACDVRFRALTAGRVALLDQPFARRTRFWPQLTHALLQRAGRRTRQLNIQRAVAAQPRLEVRLALLLWHFAARWGRVEPGGIRVPVPLTHQLLGRLVAAERPSVSHALARLAQAGLVSGHGDEWHLHGSLRSHLTEMLERGGGDAQPLSSATAISLG